MYCKIHGLSSICSLRGRRAVHVLEKQALLNHKTDKSRSAHQRTSTCTSTSAGARRPSASPQPVHKSWPRHGGPGLGTEGPHPKASETHSAKAAAGIPSCHALHLFEKGPRTSTPKVTKMRSAHQGAHQRWHINCTSTPAHQVREARDSTIGASPRYMRDE